MDSDHFTLDELKTGYKKELPAGTYQCIFCGASFESGVIFPVSGRLLEAEKAVQEHIVSDHGSVFEALLGLGRRATGLTEAQMTMLDYFHKGLPDKEIAKLAGLGSESSVRQHRFKLREKEKQAKIFLAMMANLHEGKLQESFEPIHKGAKMVDERYAITTEEKEKVLQQYFKQGLDGKLASFPTKEKRKLIVLRHLIGRFRAGHTYTEREVNEILKGAHEEDYVTLRRYMIEYGFMKRNKDGSAYWIKESLS